MREEGAAPGYGQFGGLTRVDLERFFHLDDNDHELIAARRRDSNRLGFAVQLVTVRYLSMFLANPLEVPVEVVDHLAEQLGIDDPSCVKAYTDRKQTRYDHQAEIIRKHGLIEFADIEGELATWIADQAWTTGDGPKALTAGAVRWLREKGALLPGITTLERQVTEGKQLADQRLWTHLAGQLTAGQSGTRSGCWTPGRRTAASMLSWSGCVKARSRRHRRECETRWRGCGIRTR
ncbi:DUF4158 domain-containing protein [Nocardia sp. NBC_00508]|uniref:DUF4158 domain-containing protein n=1 Tax=Nocardia sp. NBC_00508 TaxID=2975992 RepID=UPI002E81B02B|nr:DUF4158 domain-containing protein [Nocardia sp. NBC_00508]WUD65915.1 DUF4158 domain-containing protein [Nocardia sp. NBC_00508]